MAGGKETPRQKMIGMMYLVLTALLALQVSNAVLEKFAIINVTLNGLIGEGNKKSDQILQGIIRMCTPLSAIKFIGRHKLELDLCHDAITA